MAKHVESDEVNLDEVIITTCLSPVSFIFLFLWIFHSCGSGSLSFLSICIMFNGGSIFLTRTLYPKDLIIGAVTLVFTFVLYGIAQSREQRIAKLKSQYPSLVPIAVIAVAVLIIYALGSILVFIWGVTVPLAGIYH